MDTPTREPIADAPVGHTEQPSRYNSSTGGENRIEILIAEVGGVIRGAAPERRAELKELAETLLHDEVSSIVEITTQPASEARRSGANPLLPGLLLIAFGLGLMLIVPPVGMTLGVIGLILAIWGGFMSWLRK